MFTYHLKFDKQVNKADLEATLKQTAGFKTFIFDKLKGTPRGYAFVTYTQAVESLETELKNTDGLQQTKK
ncbi:hypothetical protein Ciccas_003400 [Cichlidogyrus casuarinus]|uniref:RRM domain-containing protein n=1 Tax=Cichlidogyrus casuarinus TaxID=1844966 RepID=A0ABD2QEG8_9PLAT